MTKLLCAGLCVIQLQKMSKATQIPNYVLEEQASTVCYIDHEYHQFSEEDIALMVRVVMSEASLQPMECKEAVATTMLNRYFSPEFSNNIVQIVADAYSTADNGEPNAECYEAVTNAIKWHGTPEQVVPWCCYYFRGYYFHPWAQDYRKIGDLYFSVPKDAVLD